MSMYTVSAIANMFNVTDRTIKRWCDNGYIKFNQENNNIFFTQSHIDEFKLQGKKKGYAVTK